MKFKLKIMLTWSLFVLFTLFALVLIFPSLESLCTSSVWVNKVDIPAGQVITTNLLIKVDLTTNNIYGSVQSTKAIAGKVLIVDKKANSTTYWHELDNSNASTS